ncbi:MAG: DUF512 domain-containing protein [Coriobacteriia bacterium]|nr:DUF512 domain-containing protein [Coriobacteriia bacterium]
MGIETDNSLLPTDNSDRYERSEGRPGAVLKTVAPGSPADEAGLVPGERIVRIEGEELRDIIDWMWYADDTEAEIDVEDSGKTVREVTLSRDLGQDWGIEFEDILFDGIRRCHNACTFCFMNQLPQGMRDSLYLKDDDFRLSFLQGNFVTLTNLSDADVDRIVEQHISPLYVSLHASNPQVRETLIGKNAQRGLDNFVVLAKAGIDMNVQIVLVPEVNDGAILDETLRWLKTFKDHVPSVGIVPVAYTNQTKEIAGREPKSYNSQLAAARVIEQVQHYQFEERAERETTWVYLADEFYIYAQAPFPKSEWYDEFPQYENGIGIVWSFVDEIKENLARYQVAVGKIGLGSDAATVVVGELASETLIGALSALDAGGRVRLLPVRNYFFGGNVSVTGLLTGIDLVTTIRYDSDRLERPTTYLIPDIILNACGLTLDGYTPEQIREDCGANIVFHETTVEALIECFANLKEQ